MSSKRSERLPLASLHRIGLLFAEKIPQFEVKVAGIMNPQLSIPPGAVVKATGWYDNSEKNPAKPDPKKSVP